MTFSDTAFWIALLEIIGINIVLSGDNAVVIALAARSLPPKQQRQAVLGGSAAAVVMRIVLTIAAVELLRLPYLKLIGAALLLWIGIQLLLPEKDEAHGEAAAQGGMMAAIRTILIADLVMSLDNVIGVAAAAKGSVTLLVVGLLISIPIVIFGSTLLMRFMERWPVIITIGGALLGWVAGEMAITDPAVAEWVNTNAHWLHYAAPALGAALVVVIGKWISMRAEAKSSAEAGVVAAAMPPRPLPARVRVILAVDESEASTRGVDSFVTQISLYREVPDVYLVNAQRPVPFDVSRFVDEAALRNYHEEEGAKAMTAARVALDAAGVKYETVIRVGDPGASVAQFAAEQQVAKIYVGCSGRDPTQQILGSFTSDLLRHATVPVTLLP
jgi:YjbE family integral membrane protein